MRGGEPHSALLPNPTVGPVTQSLQTPRPPSTLRVTPSFHVKSGSTYKSFIEHLPCRVTRWGILAHGPQLRPGPPCPRDAPTSRGDPLVEHL